MTDKTYNGWTNHATWLVNVWTDGDDEIARICSKRNGYVFMRAEELKEYVTAYHIDGDTESETMSGLGRDLLLSVLEDVDWRAIVLHYEDCEVSTEENDDE